MLGKTTSSTTTTTSTTPTIMEHTTSHFRLSATSCGACAVQFDSPGTFRTHSKSQWHAANLKRRIANLPPMTAEQHAVVVAQSGPAAKPRSSTEPDESTSCSDSASDSELGDSDFVPEECLFCNAVSETFDDNMVHMCKTHGMAIPDTERLIVDEETLVRYLHLVVFGYRECLRCGTQRRTPTAVRQHMLAKNHCNFDIGAADSEFRDFYEQNDNDDDDQGAEETRRAIADAIAEDGGAAVIRLSSGKILHHRSDPAPPRPKRRAAAADNTEAVEGLPPGETNAVDESQASSQLTTAPAASGKKKPNYNDENNKKALTRAEKRDAVFETQLSRLSIADRAALAHLPSAEQRSILLTQQRQADKAEKAARRLQTRLEMKANRTGQAHFVNDVPGRKNG